MSSGEVRKVSREDIQLLMHRNYIFEHSLDLMNKDRRDLLVKDLSTMECFSPELLNIILKEVQNLIERCLQLYMSQEEVINTLLNHAKIEPGFTELVWQKLEEENKEFFKAYHLRLTVKDQIMEFNRLLDKQVELMHQISPTAVASIPSSNGTHISPLQHNSGFTSEQTGPGYRANNIHPPVGSTFPSAFSNGGSSLQSCMQSAVDMSAHARRVDVSPNMMLAQRSNVAMTQGTNGRNIKPEDGYGGNLPYMFGNDGNILQARPPIADATASSFSSVESNSRPVNETLLDPDTSPFGFLGQIPPNFSLSDLTAHFSNSTDIILENFSGSPFLSADTGGFLDAHGRGDHEEDKRLDTISESLRYEDFGSD